MALDQSLANELFAPKAVIGKSRVEIGKSPVEERINEPLERLHIDRSLIDLVEERQSHAAEPQFLRHLTEPPRTYRQIKATVLSCEYL
jgi:hypothetical protein